MMKQRVLDNLLETIMHRLRQVIVYRHMRTQGVPRLMAWHYVVTP